MRNVCGFCDYFVILSGTSLRQTNAIAQGICEELEQQGIKPLSKVAANDESGWIVLDFSSIIVHVFYKPMREFYSLERLWSDAKRLKIPALKISNEKKDSGITDSINKTRPKRSRTR
jgi:ribosome-associated protein